MGTLDDQAAREATIKLASQIASLALESYQGRKLAQAEQAAVLAAVRKVQAERVFTPTDTILGGNDDNDANNSNDDTGAPP